MNNELCWEGIFGENCCRHCYDGRDESLSIWHSVSLLCHNVTSHLPGLLWQDAVWPRQFAETSSETDVAVYAPISRIWAEVRYSGVRRGCEKKGSNVLRTELTVINNFFQLRNVQCKYLITRRCSRREYTVTGTRRVGARLGNIISSMTSLMRTHTSKDLWYLLPDTSVVDVWPANVFWNLGHIAWLPTLVSRPTHAPCNCYL